MDIKNDLSALTKLVSSAAPLLGTVLSGSYYPIAIGLIAKLLGAKEEIPDILGKLSNTEDVATKLKRLEDQHCEILAKLANESFAQEMSDRESARQRQKDLHDFVPTVLALGFLVIFAGVVFFVLLHPSQSSQSILDKLTSGFMLILAYFFGGIHKKQDDHQ